jgi:hypothetical protein
VNSNNEAHDFSQDTDDSIEITPREVKKKLEKEYDEVLDFFEAPVWKQGDKPNTQINYKCKWCGNTYRAHKTSHGNLKVHRDGSTQSEKKSHGCVNRAKAKLSGAKLPPSVAERNLAQANGGGDPKQTVINGFLQNKATFVNRVLNQLIMIWQIRQALPWYRIEDPTLRAAFQYTNPKAVLYGRKWSADESKKLYSMLKKSVFDELNVSFHFINFLRLFYQD